jgi:hypothetical protein
MEELGRRTLEKKEEDLHVQDVLRERTEERI